MKKIFIPSIFTTALLIVSCNKKTDSHEGHNHSAEEHYEGDGHDHTHDAEAHSQEEFTVGNDTVKAETEHNHDHGDGHDHQH